MKTAFLIFCFLACVSSFSQSVQSLNPVFTDQNALLVPQAEGAWQAADLDLNLSIRKAGDNFYSLTNGSEKHSSTFEAAFVQIGDDYFMDLSATIPDSIGDEDYRNSLLPSHSIYKVQFKGDSLLLSALNFRWFYDYAINRKLPLAHEWTSSGMLLTMETGELLSLLVKQKRESNLFEPFTALVKSASIVEKRTNVDQTPLENNSDENFRQTCLPDFPFNDGWLGGDGDVSVSISKNQTLFLFSDSYVGNKNQQSRLEPGLKMVANTVAVVTCLPTGKTDTRYFWKDMYTDHPQPFFKSFTNRYRYWVADAFMHKEDLYVMLQKVAPKKGAAPDDIFGFSLLGVTLAKITNPLKSPADWNIDLIPLTGFSYNQMALHCHAIKDNYIYFFVSRNGNDNTQFLVRKKLDLLDLHIKPFEYYALDRTWKTDVNADDMDTVINGFRANTVNYHSDIKKWIMVCDIKFLENKIKIRTASSLRGPWSDEKVIYEIPEITPGTPSYSRSNYCYLSRECIQNYNSKTHVMTLTYDINNSSFSEINSNPKIYTPKVIAISLSK